LTFPLAQATQTTTTTVVEPAYHFNAAQWMPAAEELFRGAMVLGAIVIVGLVILSFARRYLLSVHLTLPYLIAVIAFGFYFGIGAAKPERLIDQLDIATIWVNRLFYAALLFVLIRVFDRIVLINLMTRGGKVPIQRFVHQIILIVIGVFSLLGYGSYAFGWDIDKFLAGSAVVSIVLGLALQETLGNFFSGLVMQASSPFNIGNWIVVAGVEGRVVDMNWRAVTIHTQDDNFVVIPNSTIAKEQITNFHAPTVSTACNVRIALESEMIPGEVIGIFTRAVREVPGVLPQPEPEIRLEKFEGSTILYGIKFWIDNPARHEDVEHEVRLAAWYHMRRSGYTVPYTSSTIELNSVVRKSKQSDQTDAARRLQTIESVALLSPLSPEQKHALADEARDVLLAPGQSLFRQGDAGDSFYVIQRGSVDVIIGDSPETQRTIASLNAGDFFGEMSALTGQPRTATIRAREAMVVVEIGKHDLDRIFQSDPSIMAAISDVVVQRNAQREAMQQQSTESTPEAAVEQAKSLLGRMMRFFGK